ncbi:MAG: type II toxin-antitoxin system VapC family toxin [Gammaproteobacteria bacterium]
MIQKTQEKNIYLDTNIFIYLLEGFSEYASNLAKIFELIDSRKLKAYTSELTLAEVLTKPIADDNQNLQKNYKNILSSSDVLYVAPISRDILINAAHLRAKSLLNNNNIRLPDAIHVATAQMCQCDIFLTNDQKLRSIIAMDVIFISEIAKSFSL